MPALTAPTTTGTLASLRIAVGLDQDDVAEALDVTQPQVSRWETALTRPRRSRRPELARLYGVSLNDIDDAITRTVIAASTTTIRLLFPLPDLHLRTA